MPEHKVLYLTQEEVAAAGVTMAEVIEALEIAFREHAEGRVEMPPKAVVHSRPGAFICAMPAYVPALHAVGMKWAGGYPENAKRGLPRVTGLLVLNDEETGMPLAIMDGVWITAKRTGAATALSAKHLARPDSQVVGILGCGVQGRSNLEALNILFPLTQVMAYDPSPQQLDAFTAEAAAQGLEVVKAGEPREAVDGCDLVVTAGVSRPRHRTIKPGWLNEGAFASLLDLDAYWEDAALQEVDKFTTDDLPQMEHYQAMGHFQGIPAIHATLGEIAAGKKPGRQTEKERTIAANIGAAMADMATAVLVHRRAVERGLGRWLPL